jgi:hypothetical protein
MQANVIFQGIGEVATVNSIELKGLFSAIDNRVGVRVASNEAGRGVSRVSRD